MNMLVYPAAGLALSGRDGEDGRQGRFVQGWPTPRGGLSTASLLLRRRWRL